MTECIEAAPEPQLKFDFGLGKPVVGAFSGGRISSDGGLVLLRQADRKLKLIEQAALCIVDKRRPDLVQHSVADLLRQRIMAIGSGYEDANDAAKLRSDPMHKLCRDANPSGADLASQPTISRFENFVTEKETEFLQDLLVHVYLENNPKPPKKLVLDLDTTCDPVHGYQQLSFFNGYSNPEIIPVLKKTERRCCHTIWMNRPGSE